MDYPLMDPPFDMIPFNNMKKKDAEKHFKWYMDSINKRIHLLKKAYDVTSNEEKSDINFKPESLIYIWGWFIQKVETIPKSNEEIEEQMKSTPSWLCFEQEKNSNKLSMGTLALAMDIAMYLGEVFRNEYKNLKWGYVTKPKTLTYVNKPVVVGFDKIEALDPMNIVHNLTLDVSEGINMDEKALYELYNVWCEYV